MRNKTSYIRPNWVDKSDFVRHIYKLAAILKRRNLNENQNYFMF
jgi:hypothetical protein